jgi:[FeFe] hydrogenase H-cluster maturation GTPase HydF
MSSLNSTPMANRTQIAIFGRRNTGKSTLINALTNQQLAVVSDVAGTTTDPVFKTMEFLPVGPVVMVDTAGFDDEGTLGSLRVEKTMEVLRKTDLAILVLSSEDGAALPDVAFAAELKAKGISAVAVLSKADLHPLPVDEVSRIGKEVGLPIIAVSAAMKTGIEELKELIARHAKYDDSQLHVVGDLIKPGDFVVLVTPIDKAAPKGRLILPQQQTIRDIIECDAVAIVTKEHELKETLANLGKKPALVVTDSQVFLKVSADVPNDIPLTGFSILFARMKGELDELVRGLKAIENLKPGSHVLIVEGCTHHRQSDDIGTVKIPRWIRQMTGGEVSFEWASGAHFPKELEKYDAIVHCGACMLNKPEMRYRMNYAREHGIPMTNYGMLIAHVQGVLERAIAPFPSARLAWEELENG